MSRKKEASLKKLPAKAVTENTAVLEDLFLNANLDTSYLDDSFSTRDKQIIDVAIATLAQYGNTVTIKEILDAEEITHDYNYDSYLIQALTDIYALWVDKEAIINRQDNVLRKPDRSTAHWKELFNYELSKLIVKKGTLMAHYRTAYGWQDYQSGKTKFPEAVAAFSVKEDYWDEFAGTFVTEDDSRTGFTCHVMFSNGIFRDFRYEGSLAQVMKELD
jgi:hypothetical protein